MRTSKDVYKNPLGRLITLLNNSEQSDEFIKAHGLKLWNGYDYKNQYWVHNGERDTRTLDELKAEMAAKNPYICTWCKNGEHIECEADMCTCKH